MGVVLMDAETHEALEVSVFAGGYTARKVGFWLRHWLELAALAEDWASSGDLARDLAREWELLRWRSLEPHRPAVERRQLCLCAELHDQGTYTAPAVAGARKVGDARAAVKGVLADLLLAGEALPVGWRATRKVFARQQRQRAWLVRYQAWRTGAECRAADRLPEPEAGAYGRVLRAMAAHLAGGDVLAALADQLLAANADTPPTG